MSTPKIEQAKEAISAPRQVSQVLVCGSWMDEQTYAQLLWRHRSKPDLHPHPGDIQSRRTVAADEE